MDMTAQAAICAILPPQPHRDFPMPADETAAHAAVADVSPAILDDKKACPVSEPGQSA